MCQSSGISSSAAALRPIDLVVGYLSEKQVPFILPGDPTWKLYAETYNTRLQYSPAVIVLPDRHEHISEAVAAAARHKLKVQAKSGGHSYASFSNGGQGGSMMIHLHKLQKVELGPDGTIAKVGAGCRLGNLDLAIYKHGRALAHGTWPGVGVGGHFTHGGYGYSSRAWGLALDQIVGLDVVLADGRHIHATETRYPDVYFAMRGAADSFGIVVNFYLKTQPAPVAVVNWAYQFDNLLDDIPAAVEAFQHIQKLALDPSAIDRRLSFGMTFNESLCLHISGVYMGRLADFNDNIAPKILSGIAISPSSSSVKDMDWLQSLTALSGRDELSVPEAGFGDRHNFAAKSVTTPDPISATTLASYFTYIRDKGPSVPVSWFAIVNLYGGADSQISARGPDFSAYPHRDSLWVVQHYASAPLGKYFPFEGLEFLEGLNEALTRGMDRYGAYVNYADATLSLKKAHLLYYGIDLYRRLEELKESLDPGNIFANPQSIGRGLHSDEWGQKEEGVGSGELPR